MNPNKPTLIKPESRVSHGVSYNLHVKAMRPFDTLIVEHPGHPRDASNRRGGEHGKGSRSEVEITQTTATRAAICNRDSYGVPIRFVKRNSNYEHENTDRRSHTLGSDRFATNGVVVRIRRGAPKTIL